MPHDDGIRRTSNPKIKEAMASFLLLMKVLISYEFRL